MITLELSHGGSGPYGNSAWGERATGCLEKARLQRLYPRPCSEVYSGSRKAMLIGSMVHAYIEQELMGADLPEEGQAIRFIDSTCQWEPDEEDQQEAARVYWGWRDVRSPFDGETLGAEILLDEEVGPGLRVQAKIDHLVRDKDGVIAIEDFKTASRSGNTYTTGRTRLQLHLYCMAAWEAGYDVQRLRIRQIVKTKQIQEHLYDNFDLPDPTREAWILRYLQGAKEREQQNLATIPGYECDFCPYGKRLLCKL